MKRAAWSRLRGHWFARKEVLTSAGYLMCAAGREDGAVIAVPAGMRVLVAATKPVDFRRGVVLLPRLLLAFEDEDIEQNILVETNGLTSSLSFLLCHPNAEAAQLVIVDELDSGVFECRLNFDQS